MENVILITLNFLTFLVTILQTKPVPICEPLSDVCNYNKEQCEARVRRSIPDMDAVNPDFMDGNVALDSEHSRSQLSMEGGVSDSQAGRDALAGEESVADEILNSDAQEECYRQQNIDPPKVEKSGWNEQQSSRDMPIMDEAQRPLQPSLVHRESARLRGVRYNNKKQKDEITSLYSEAERIMKLKDAKHSHRSRVDDNRRASKRIYKPVGIVPNFPVYDGDIDFEPDPLQGILDEKYWQDQADQEGVIKKYMDLANYNMMPPGMDIKKREPERTGYKVRSVSSYEGFKDASSEKARNCPCKEWVACGDCSKGKTGKKSNYTQSDDVVACGRRLLSLDNDESVILKQENNDYISPLRKFKTLNFDDDLNFEIDDSVPNSNIKRIGRKLLSFSHDERDDDIEESDEDVVEVPNLGQRNFVDEDESKIKDEFLNEENAYDDDNNNIHRIKSFDQHMLNQQHNQPLNKVPEEAQIFSEHSKNRLSEDPVPLHSPVYNLPNKPAGYYTANKWANRLQKILQTKKKEPASRNKDVNTTNEFELVQHEVFKNASMVQATYEPANKTTKYCQCSTTKGILTANMGYVNPTKGRRSYPERSFMNEHRLSHVVQASDDAVVQNIVNIVNQTSLTSMPTVTTPSLDNSTVQVNVTSSISLEFQGNVTSGRSITIAHAIATAAPVKKTMKSYEEETIDAEVANDIVETVIEESQRSSLLGNGLGICRRNDSLNLRYGRVIPETEKVLRSVTDCLMKRLKDHLAKQSCIILDPELLQFLRWMVLKGESNKDHLQRINSVKYRTSKPAAPVTITSCGPVGHVTESTTCDPDLNAPPPPA